MVYSHGCELIYSTPYISVESYLDPIFFIFYKHTSFETYCPIK